MWIGSAHYGVDTSRESQKAGGVSSYHSPSTNISKLPSHLSTISRFCRPLVRCGRCLVDTQARVDRCWAPVTSNPSLGGTAFVPSRIEFMDGIHLTTSFLMLSILLGSLATELECPYLYTGALLWSKVHPVLTSLAETLDFESEHSELLELDRS